MLRRTRAVSALAVAGAAAALVATTLPTVASAATAPKVITVTVSNKAITFAQGTSVPAGNVVFKAKAAKGSHDLQIVALHAGYTKSEFKKDINDAFQGDHKAIKRVDNNVD